MFHTDNRNLEFVTILPVCRPDVHLAIKLLKWLELMGGDDGLGGQFDVWMAPNVAREYGDQLEELASRCGPRLSVVTCAGLKEMGYFGSANQMFKGALEHVESNYPGRAMLWMEADCVPMSRHWIAEIGNEYRLCERPFMGDVVRSQINHMTGVAMYHPEWRKYAPSFENCPDRTGHGAGTASARPTLCQIVINRAPFVRCGVQRPSPTPVRPRSYQRGARCFTSARTGR